jgi:geranylgeranyl diphosphate synthase type I
MTNITMRDQIQEAMRAAFPATEARVAQFYYIQAYHLGWRDANLETAFFDPGKLLRPRLVLLAALAVGGSVSQALPLAAGIQLLHDFSLIHDDIEDNSDTRRGRTTVWKLWGLAQGINVGDGMFTLAHLAVHRLADTGLPATTVLDVLRRFDEAILTICEGQYLDLSYEGRLDIDEAGYLAMISRKTAALFAASTGLGAIVGGADAASARALFDFGQNLGLAFQMQDDLLGIWGEPDQTGKPAAADITQRKLTLPVIYALRHAEQRAELAQIYQQPQLSAADSAHVIDILAQAGAQGYTEGMARHYEQAAAAALQQVQPADTPAARDALGQMHALLDKLTGRTT